MSAPSSKVLGGAAETEGAGAAVSVVSVAPNSDPTPESASPVPVETKKKPCWANLAWSSHFNALPWQRPVWPTDGR